MVELVVAMTVTLIVSSAIYGLLTAGSSAFRREPEIADRQQNIRAAMDIVTRDVYAGGAALTTFAQVFSRTDPAGNCTASLNSCGPTGSMGPTAAAARGAGDDEDTDVLEVLSTDEQCPQLAVCNSGPIPGVAGTFVTQERLPQCLQVPGLVAMVRETSFTYAAATASGGTTSCSVAGAAPPNGNLVLTATLQPWVAAAPGFLPVTPVPGGAGTVYLYRGRVVRYRIGPSLDPADPIPGLWRTESGRYAADGSLATEPGTAGFNPVNSPWQLVARGIEDLQIEYLDGTGAWQNQPPVSITDDWTTIVRRVRITLSARVGQQNLGGESTAGGGAPNAVRGQLSAVVAPRAAMTELQICRSAAAPCAVADQIQ
jgi:hypothetical protein